LVDLIDGRSLLSLESLASIRRGPHVATIKRRGERVEAKFNVQ
jgi:hypothetical protein